jgi:UDP-N-acetylmuramyl pentapeptide phosphotransferase/UDP-N-acetylglucosamine-1-phosphate transferase
MQMLAPLAIADNGLLAVLLTLAGVFGAGVLLSVVGGRLVIPWLVRRKLNDGEQRKASDYLNLLHADKKNTPTMGGAFLVPSVVLASLIGGVALTLQGGSPAKVWGSIGVAAFVLLAGAGLGLCVDYCKLTGRGLVGISAGETLRALGASGGGACSGAAFLVGVDGRGG